MKHSGAARAARLHVETRGLAPFGYYCSSISKQTVPNTSTKCNKKLHELKCFATARTEDVGPV